MLVETAEDFSELEIENVEKSDEGEYTCVVKNDFGEDKCAVTLTVEGNDGACVKKQILLLTFVHFLGMSVGEFVLRSWKGGKVATYFS